MMEIILSAVLAVHNGLTKMKSILPRKVKHRKQGRSDDLLEATIALERESFLITFPLSNATRRVEEEHHETALFPATEILPTHETEIELAPVSEEKISTHESDTFPCVSYGTKMMPAESQTTISLETKFPFIPDFAAASNTTRRVEEEHHDTALFPATEILPTRETEIKLVPSVFELVEWWIQEGFIARNMVDARKRGLDMVKNLVDTALLEGCEEGVCKMNDAANLALRILSQDVRAHPNLESGSLSTSLESLERDKFLMRAGAGLSQPPPKKEWEQRKMIFLMDNKFSSLPVKPNCPILLTLFLQRNHRLRVIPENFFEVMPSLEVLNLSKTRINSLPASLSNLKSLKALIMRDRERLVKLPSEVGKLTTLEVLDLSGIEINHLPNEIGNLTSLWYLDVSFYGPVDHREYPELPSLLISPGILSKLIALKNLSIKINDGKRTQNPS